MQSCLKFNQNDMSMITRFKEFNFLYHNEFQYFCFKNCLYQFLQLTEVENPLLFIKVGFQLIVDKGTYQIPRYINTNPLFDMNHFKFGYGMNFLSTLERNLSELPVIVITDVYHLPYRKEYLKLHGSHAVFLIGSEKGKIHIMDWYAPYFFKGSIDITDFEKARTSTHIGNSNPFCEKEIQNFWYKPQNDILNINITDNVIENYNSIFSISREHTETSYSGIESFEALIAFISEYQFSDVQFMKIFCKNLHNELLLYIRSARLAHLYFTNVIEKYEGLIDKQLLRHLENCICFLDRLGMNLLKASLSTPSGYIEAIKKDLDNTKNEILKISHLRI